MNTSKIIELVMYCIPALITAGIALYFFKSYFEEEEKKRRYHLFKDTQQNVLPLKLQAYERMTLFLERTHPVKLVLRILPLNQDVKTYANQLIQSIENEFEHNLAQQIYMSPEAWNVICKSKNAVIANIRILSTQAETAEELRNKVITTQGNEHENTTNIALLFIKNEVSTLLN